MTEQPENDDERIISRKNLQKIEGLVTEAIKNYPPADRARIAAVIAQFREARGIPTCEELLFAAPTWLYSAMILELFGEGRASKARGDESAKASTQWATVEMTRWLAEEKIKPVLLLDDDMATRILIGRQSGKNRKGMTHLEGLAEITREPFQISTIFATN